MKRYLLVILILPFFAQSSFAQTLKSNKFLLQAGKGGPMIKTNTASSHIALSANLIDYGPLAPTNPIKREISVTAGDIDNIIVFQNHPLLARINEANEIIPDTTCDNGGCNGYTKATWINPFTFGLGFSFDDISYQQFLQTPTRILPGKMTIKLNINQNQRIGSYTNTLTFWAIPKL